MGDGSRGPSSRKSALNAGSSARREALPSRNEASFVGESASIGELVGALLPVLERALVAADVPVELGAASAVPHAEGVAFLLELA